MIHDNDSYWWLKPGWQLHVLSECSNDPSDSNSSRFLGSIGLLITYESFLKRIYETTALK